VEGDYAVSAKEGAGKRETGKAHLGHLHSRLVVKTKPVPNITSLNIANTLPDGTSHDRTSPKPYNSAPNPAIPELNLTRPYLTITLQNSIVQNSTLLTPHGTLLNHNLTLLPP
jgi:hypothetical protein